MTIFIFILECDTAGGSLVSLALPQPVCEMNDYFTDTIPGVPYTASFKKMSLSAARIPDNGIYLSSFRIASLVHSGGTLKYNFTGAEVCSSSS